MGVWSQHALFELVKRGVGPSQCVFKKATWNPDTQLLQTFPYFYPHFLYLSTEACELPKVLANKQVE